MVSSMNEGYCKGVLSGDLIVVSGKLKKGSDEVPDERNIFLSCISAPKLNSQTTYEEDYFGWEARNFLRNSLIGKVVKYSEDYTIGENSFCQVVSEQGVNMNMELVKKGLAKVNLNKSNESMQRSDFLKKLKSLETEAEKNKFGIWKESKDLEKIVKRKITKSDDVNYEELFSQIKGKEVDAMIENVVNCSAMYILLKDQNCIVKASLRFVCIPKKSEFFYKAGKAYVERLFIHRDVKLKAFQLEDKSLIVDIYDYRPNPQTGIKELKNLGIMVLTSAFSKLFSHSCFSDKSELDAAKEAQSKAMLSGIRCWEGYVMKSSLNTEEKKFSTSTPQNVKSSFDGKIQSVVSGDCICIKDSKNIVHRVYFSYIKARGFASKNSLEEDKPWAWEGKEYLRKHFVGKPCTAVFNYSRELKNDMVMNFYMISVLDNEVLINLNAAMLEQGLAVLSKPQSSDLSDFPAEFEEIEKKAKEEKKCIHSDKSPGIPNFIDLSNADVKKKRDSVPRNAKLKNCFCVVDYVYYPTKFKLRVDKTTCYIPFKLIGLKSIEKDINNSEKINALLNIGTEYLNDSYLQREGNFTILHADNKGIYYGVLTIGNVNIGAEILKKGHAIIHNPQNYALPGEYAKAQDEAIKSKIGIWGESGLDKLLKGTDTYGVTQGTTLAYVENEELLKIRVVDMVNFKQIYCNFIPNKSLSHIEKVLAEYENQVRDGLPLDPPIKKGTICICKYQVDLRFYRVKITNLLKDDQIEVEFLDYGTIDIVDKRNLFKMDSEISTYPPQYVECELAGLKFSKNSISKAQALYPNLIDFETILPAKTVYTYEVEGKVKHGIIIFFEKISNIKETIHYDLLSKGFAKLNSKKPIGTSLSEFKPAQKIASDKIIGMWTEMDDSDEEVEE